MARRVVMRSSSSVAAGRPSNPLPSSPGIISRSSSSAPWCPASHPPSHPRPQRHPHRRPFRAPRPRRLAPPRPHRPPHRPRRPRPHRPPHRPRLRRPHRPRRPRRVPPPSWLLGHIARGEKGVKAERGSRQKGGQVGKRIRGSSPRPARSRTGQRGSGSGLGEAAPGNSPMLVPSPLILAACGQFCTLQAGLHRSSGTPNSANRSMASRGFAAALACAFSGCGWAVGVGPVSTADGDVAA